MDLNNSISFALISIALGALPAASYAAPKALPAQLNVSASVHHQCSISLTGRGLNFHLSALPADSQQSEADIRLDCTAGLPFQVGFDYGAKSNEIVRQFGGENDYTFYIFTSLDSGAELGYQWGVNTLSLLGASPADWSYVKFRLEFAKQEGQRGKTAYHTYFIVRY